MSSVCTEISVFYGSLPVAEIAAIPRAERSARLVLQLYIDPDACTCCAACEPVCPVGAIFAEEEVPPQWRAAIARNAAFFSSPAESRRAVQ